MEDGLEKREEEAPLWKLVNELCEVAQKNPIGFNPKIHVPLSQKIVDKLDGELRPSRRFMRSSSYDSLKGKCEILGEDKKRIGNYIATKSKIFLGLYNLEFEYFLGRDQEYILFDKREPSTYIRYNKRNKQIKSIGITRYETRRIFLLGNLTITNILGIQNPLWKS